MNNKRRAIFAVEALELEYPKSECSLSYKDPLQLLIATRLAAQCTDKRVNMVTPALFSHYITVYDFANADVTQLEEEIKSCGLYKTKARDIIAMCKKIISDYSGRVPDSIEELIKLPGVGRKTANLIVGDIFHKPAVVVDTHCIRITSRIGFHSTNNAAKIERILRELLPPDKSNEFCHRLVLHGRIVCKAKHPKCDLCCLRNVCDYNKKAQAEMKAKD